MTELEKCMAGKDYNCHDKIFLDFKSHARKLLQEYNALAYEQKEEKEKILKSYVERLAQKYLLHHHLYAIMGETFSWEITYQST